MFPKAAAYVRVSTNSNEQAHSLEFQINYWKKFFEEPSCYEFVGIYVDKGISGKSASNRPEFNRMLNDARFGKIQHIFCKSVQRFSRNTGELLSIIRELRELQVVVHFEREGIDTSNPSDDLKLTVAAAIAEDDLSRYSENVSWSFKEKFKRGEGMYGGRVYGYSLLPKGQLVKNESEAKIVRRIFHEYLDMGFSANKISRWLNHDDIPSSRGKKWTQTVVMSILKNEKYVGDLILQKYFNKKGYRVINHGERDSYYVKNHHEAIIERNRFEAVQKLIEERGNTKLRGKKNPIYPFTGLVVCGFCDRHYQHRVCNSGNVSEEGYWGCPRSKKREFENDEPCATSIVKDSVLKEKFVEAYNEFVLNELKPKEEESLINEKNALLEQQKDLIRLNTHGWVKSDFYESENASIKAKIDSIDARLQSFAKHNVGKIKLTPIQKFSEEKLFLTIEKVVVHMYVLEFYFYNGVVIEKTYTNRKKHRRDGIKSKKWGKEESWKLK